MQWTVPSIEKNAVDDLVGLRCGSLGHLNQFSTWESWWMLCSWKGLEVTLLMRNRSNIANRWRSNIANAFYGYLLSLDILLFLVWLFFIKNVLQSIKLKNAWLSSHILVLCICACSDGSWLWFVGVLDLLTKLYYKDQTVSCFP